MQVNKVTFSNKRKEHPAASRGRDDRGTQSTHYDVWAGSHFWDFEDFWGVLTHSVSTKLGLAPTKIEIGVMHFLRGEPPLHTCLHR